MGVLLIQTSFYYIRSLDNPHSIVVSFITSLVSVFVEQEKVLEYIESQTTSQVESSGVKFWICGVCQKILNNKSALARHIESFHVETDPYSCPYCEFSVIFRTRRALQRHVNSAHKN